ncbi:hypothetical protein AN944_04161 [Shewanella sp. P1-14-1]|nr:hypothetical protein AN944_04161 [Shewanella sp. P1-14-1]
MLLPFKKIVFRSFLKTFLGKVVIATGQLRQGLQRSKKSQMYPFDGEMYPFDGEVYLFDGLSVPF